MAFDDFPPNGSTKFIRVLKVFRKKFLVNDDSNVATGLDQASGSQHASGSVHTRRDDRDLFIESKNQECAFYLIVVLGYRSLGSRTLWINLEADLFFHHSVLSEFKNFFP